MSLGLLNQETLNIKYKAELIKKTISCLRENLIIDEEEKSVWSQKIKCVRFTESLLEYCEIRLYFKGNHCVISDA